MLLVSQSDEELCMNSDTEHSANRSSWIQRTSLFLGPLAAIGILKFVDLAPENPNVTKTAAIAVWMAIWWIGEAIPLAATALLPLVLFPLLGVLPGKQIAGQYINSTIFLFLGGFLVALAMQRWDLHKRLALWILLRSGVHPWRLLLGFMGATWFLSMWISNTATTMMMVPIGLAIVLELEETISSKQAKSLGIGIFLGIAYGASIGGLATLVGTPPNLSFSRIFANLFPAAPEITFAQWFIFAFPLSVVFFFITWFYLACRFCRSSDEELIDEGIFRRQYDELGPISFAECAVLVHFVLMILLWLFRGDLVLGSWVVPGWSRLFPDPKAIDDGTVAITVSLLLFVIPSFAGKTGPSRILDWDTAVKVPWGLVLLFGGGFALAFGFAESGLSLWLGGQLEGLRGMPILVVIGAVCLLLTFLTELTSNTATAEMLLPVLAALAIALEVNPLLLMVPGTLACSCAFMLPVATPPNAIVFATEQLSIGTMARTGFVINLIGAVLITIWLYFASGLLGIEFEVFPEWAKAQSVAG